MNTAWTQHPHFAALDWASDHHDVTVLDRTGAIVAEFRFAHTAAGWAEFTEKLKPFPGTPFTLETSSGPAVDQLLQRGLVLYPLAPGAAARYRERKAPSGTKTDRHDAGSMADALRTDGHVWRMLRPQDEATATLRVLCRDEIGLIEQRTLLVNQLQAALREYYPAALAAFADWTVPTPWTFLQQFPTPVALQTAGQRKWEKFLHTHKLWRPQTREERLAVFAAANALPASAAVVSAKSLLAVSLAKVLATLQDQIDEYRQRIGAAFRAHPDHDIFGGLPGAKDVLAPRLLAELGGVRAEYPDADALMCQAGVSPVSYQSGQVERCRLRRACVKSLRAAQPGQAVAEDPLAAVAEPGALRRKQTSSEPGTTRSQGVGQAPGSGGDARRHRVNNFYEKALCNPENICGGKRRAPRRFRATDLPVLANHARRQKSAVGARPVQSKTSRAAHCSKTPLR
jgi:transposase